jgi:hypothetical protein
VGSGRSRPGDGRSIWCEMVGRVVEGADASMKTMMILFSLTMAVISGMALGGSIGVMVDLKMSPMWGMVWTLFIVLGIVISLAIWWR